MTPQKIKQQAQKNIKIIQIISLILITIGLKYLIAIDWKIALAVFMIVEGNNIYQDNK